MRRRAIAGILAVTCLGAVACAPSSTARHGHSPGTGRTSAAHQPLGSAHGCSTVVARAPALTSVGVSFTKVSAGPFGVVATGDHGFDFVASTAGVLVLRNNGPAVPSLVHVVRLRTGGQSLGEALTPDGRYLLVADAQSGAVVLSVRRMEAGGSGAVAGVLNASGRHSFGGAIEVAVSRDGKFAFVSLEGSGSVAVFNLRRALTSGFGAEDYVGAIGAGIAPVGLAVSPDGHWLYATSELTRLPGRKFAQHGTLSVIDLRKAETDPAASVVATVDARCQPVRVITSADGSTVWVTARASDAVLGFSAAKLVTDPAHALITAVGVGEAPVGLALAGRGSRIVVADSNRFGVQGASSSLAVVDIPDALAGRPALLGYLKAGLFPREMTLVPGGRTLLVTNFLSGQLESVNVAGLP
jgi:DNA-binding beta-propeller fold protein YncE